MQSGNWSLSGEVHCWLQCNYQRKEPGFVRDDDGDDDNDDDNNNNHYYLTKVHGQYTLRYRVKNWNKNNINFNNKQLATV